MSGNLVKILDGNTFVVSDDRGDIEASPTDPTGLFSFDTRFLSRWVLTIDGERLNALSTDDIHYFETRFFLVPGTGTVYVDSKLSVIRRRAVGHGFHEELQILNHDEQPVKLKVRLEAACDFADLFEVKDALKKQGTYRTKTNGGKLELSYERETYKRATVISSSTGSRSMSRSSHTANGRRSWTSRRPTSVGASCGRCPRGTGIGARTCRRTSTSGSTVHLGSSATGIPCGRRTARASSTSPRCGSRR
jgi:glycogen debranching enzyme